MSTLDIVLLVLLLIFTWRGLSKGIIRLLGSLVAIIAGSFLASRYYLIFFEWAQDFWHGKEGLGKTLAFVILFIAITWVINAAFSLAARLWGSLSFIPFTKLIDKVLGAAIGLLQGAFFMGLIIYVSSKYVIIGSLWGNTLVDSQVAPWLLKVTQIILPVLPDALRALQSVI